MRELLLAVLARLTVHMLLSQKPNKRLFNDPCIDLVFLFSKIRPRYFSMSVWYFGADKVADVKVVVRNA